MRIRKLTVRLSIFLLAFGLLLFAIATVRETHVSTVTSSSWGSVSTQYFQYGGVTLTPDNPPLFIVGTTGTADLIVLKTHWRDFSDWVCREMQLRHEYSEPDCQSFWGGDINATILYSYLQTHQSQIAYSQTIVDQNVTLDNHVTTTTNLTIALLHLGSGIAINFWQQTRTNQTLSYPLIGYTERQGVIWSLPSISLGIIALGTAGLVLSLSQFKTGTSKKSMTYRMSPIYQGPPMKKCPACGRENLFFTENCRHCNAILPDEAPKLGNQ